MSEEIKPDEAGALRELQKRSIQRSSQVSHVGLRFLVRGPVFILKAMEPALSYRGSLESDLHFRNLILAIWMMNMATEETDQ